MYSKRNVLAAIAVSAFAVGSTPALATAAGSDDRRPGANATELPADVLAAMQRDYGVSADEIKKQRGLQADAAKLDQQLQGSLGAAYAGSAYDARTGKLIVRVSDAAQVSKAKSAGADARPAKYSKAQLDAITAELDGAAGKAKGSSATDRKPNGARQASVAGVTSWYVDGAANVVHVTAKPGQSRAAAATLAKYGDAVTIEESDLAAVPAGNFMDGGDLINGSSCSAGFNLRNASTGKGYLFTAGHCVSAGTTLRGQGNVNFGPVLEKWFPTYDDAIARNDNSAYWWQGPWVDTNPSNGGFITTTSYTNSPVGTYVCKSGITTRWTCGYIRVKNETITYSGQTTPVYGLTRHSACTEPGDSGGAFVSVTSKYSAEGLTSGASMIWDGSRYRCRAVFGQQNVSWAFPVATSISYYGPKYGIAFW